MRVALVLLALSGVFAGCKSADKSPAAGEDKAAARDAAAVAVPPLPVLKPDAAPASGDLPPDLEKLAEMPELTAEASEAEINRRIDRALDGFTAFIDLIGEHSDCAAMGRSLSRFADANQRFFQSLQKLDNPELQKRLHERIMARGTEWISKIAKNLQRCAEHPAVMAALLKLSQQQSQ